MMAFLGLVYASAFADQHRPDAPEERGVAGDLALPAASDAETRLTALEAELARLQRSELENARRQQILSEELRKLRESAAVPEEPPLGEAHGMGPAASKVYRAQRGLSIGGYGQGWLSMLGGSGSKNQADLKRLVLYTGYKFSDKLVLNSELEFEHATTEETGSVSVEFAQLDYLRSPELSFRAGLLLAPVGFVNEVHEPLFYHGNERPEVERKLIPTTWRENGFGIFGKLGDTWEYRAYLMGSLAAKDFVSGGLAAGRQAGSRSVVEDWSAALRLDCHLTPEFTLGGSLFSGDQGQGSAFAQDAAGTLARPSAHLNLREVHAQYRSGGLQLRALGVVAELDDADVLSRALALRGLGPVGSRLSGAYAEAAYDLMPHLNRSSNASLEVYFRREAYDTLDRVAAGFADDPSQDVRVSTLGLDYKPEPRVVLKLDHRSFSAGRGVRPSEVNLGFGWVF
jgi:hypothetical protein